MALENIFKLQLATIPDFYQINDNEVSIYIGIPFCPTKCAYCTFPAYQIRKNDERMQPFLNMLFEEIDLVFEILTEKKKSVTSIYFGGGTPTSLSAEDLEKVLVKIYEKIDLSKLREITVEAGRPDTIDEEKLAVLKKYKIDRISVNP
ncbi:MULTISPECIES: radical SAM protein [unclassified Gemella]|uniref:radical SAM protein n=1 Tax=unclassified Gemella TaxID=2624949 RepID=UPI001C05791A|nr:MULTISPECIES: radical SAM protein [unclassified Gemella]MBU0279029.1 radical SAM protein [Gemella sp. zg-1178]QWQ39101.1 radical SAM protein [Gemella sp. zg-570]